MKIGFILNPIAGMGGSVGLKGTDGRAYGDALRLGAVRTSHLAAERALSGVGDDAEFISAEKMGSEVLSELGIEHRIIPMKKETTTGNDTRAVAKMMKDDCDLILFCGGDGTARDILDAIGEDTPVLGIPAGVKMYSSVFATTPEDVRSILKAFVNNETTLMKREVTDINEEYHRNGILSARFYGYLTVPYVASLVQSCKGTYDTPDEYAEADEVAEYVVSQMRDDTLYIIGPGSTTGRIMERMGMKHTLLGIDAVFNNELAGFNMNESKLIDMISRYDKRILILGIIGKQGFFIGRGNKELTPAVIRMIGIDNIMLVSGITKLNDLKELHADTGDPELDKQLKGYRKVVFRYGRERIVRVT
ncbi:MAG: ATP-NAD kinase family protein [Methanomassiliicoccaceae archaeon]|nr:ATP-NAD kinase family protein [Methanomassiliicoccaceae archaeon]